MSMKNIPAPSLSTNSEMASLFDRVAGILDSGRGRVLRTINHETVLAYWLIGREIVQALQSGEARAQYGNTLIADLSNHLTESYGAGFSVANLKNFRQFYQAYADRTVSNSHPSDSQLTPSEGLNSISYPVGSESPTGFHPNLSWSHYRTLMRVGNIAARQFYETESVHSNWSRRDLERQIGSLFYERLMASTDKTAMLDGTRHETMTPHPHISANLSYSSPFKGESVARGHTVGDGGDIRGIYPIPTPALPLKGREKCSGALK